MAPSDYTSSGGGALKLKGAGVEKKKKKKKHTQASADTAPSKDEPTTLESGDPLTQTSEDKISKLKNAEEDSAALELSEDVKDDLLEYKSKTEAERRHEERRRQRVCCMSPWWELTMLTMYFRCTRD